MEPEGWGHWGGGGECEKGCPELAELWSAHSAGECGWKGFSRVFSFSFFLCFFGEILQRCRLFYFIVFWLACKFARPKNEDEAGLFNWWGHPALGSVLDMTRTGLSRESNPAEGSCDSPKRLTMSERCNLKAVTAALCCFNHKNSVISGKVRESGMLSLTLQFFNAKETWSHCTLAFVHAAANTFS